MSASSEEEADGEDGVQLNESGYKLEDYIYRHAAEKTGKRNQRNIPGA